MKYIYEKENWTDFYWNGDITKWLLWFLQCIEKSIDSAESTMNNILIQDNCGGKNIGYIFIPDSFA